MSNDEPEDPSCGFSIQIPGLTDPVEMMKRIKEEHVRLHMQADAMAQRADEFFDSLSIPQCLMLFRILEMSRGNKKVARHFEGRLVEQLRLRHGVDPKTGLTPEEAALKLQQECPPEV